MKRKLKEEADAKASKRVASSNEEPEGTSPATAGSMRLSEFLEASTLPELGPFKSKDTRSQAKFYVRECFPRLYDHIMELFNNDASPTRGVTVVGMPGVGKTLFMAYVFQRYRLENALSNIHVETRKTNLRLKKLCVWEGARTALMVCKNTDVDVDRLVTVRSQDDAIRLVDGCPESVPQCKRWICFTRSRLEWEAATHSMRTHQRLVLPVWTTTELRDAALALNYDSLVKDASELTLLGEEEDPATYHAQLKMNQDVVGIAHSVFGGVPRQCLEEDTSQMQEGVRSLVDICDNLRYHAHAETRLSQRLTLEKTALFQHFFQGNTNDVEDVVSAVGSPFIEQQFRDGFLDSLVTDKARFKDFPTDEPLQDWLTSLFFEVRVHQTLQMGTTIKAKAFSLDGKSQTPKTKTFQIKPTLSIHLLATRFKRAHLLDGPYYIPKTKATTSVDGFYIGASSSTRAQPRAILFFVSKIYKPLPCDGIVQVLKNLELWDDVQRSPADADGVAIVHVVPVEDIHKYKRQRFEVCDELWEDSSVDQIQGMGRVGVKMLKTQHQIENVQHLDACESEATVVVMAKRLLEAHRARIETSSRRVAETVEKIPQFLWGF